MSTHQHALSALTHRYQLILTCEHATQHIPEEYAVLFTDRSLFNTHRSIDFGAHELMIYLKTHLPCDHAYAADVSRLLIDNNRSLSHRQCFSTWSQHLSTKEKKECIERYYTPFRMKVFNTIKSFIEQKKPVLHLSIHSFTPILNQNIRTTDIGLLYDPKRPKEKQWVCAMQHALKHRLPQYLIHKNAPYRGTSDGHTSALRRFWSDEWYIGIEYEINQKHTQPKVNAEIFMHILDSLR